MWGTCLRVIKPFGTYAQIGLIPFHEALPYLFSYIYLGVIQAVYGMESFDSKMRYLSGGFLFKDSFTMNNEYIPVFFRVAEYAYMTGKDPREFYDMDINEFNQWYYALKSFKTNEEMSFRKYLRDLCIVFITGESPPDD
jgi:hypothetical protein